ncbi:hypothetical protein HELRODRAFT_184765 [Helobdella robusta]|uniref:Uncharacterized protein n=1 Tax=Helobdella robusta TaxID=6412 RepID=T1FLY2_HELRO|nr:hypothetical protein HELRODRAFT_184765 [Helobdella robusta]ESN99888.1 hypothetical protein HELRODRAFT_184765 [Helobdella robusta]
MMKTKHYVNIVKADGGAVSSSGVFGSPGVADLCATAVGGGSGPSSGGGFGGVSGSGENQKQKPSSSSAAELSSSSPSILPKSDMSLMQQPQQLQQHKQPLHQKHSLLTTNPVKSPPPVLPTSQPQQLHLPPTTTNFNKNRDKTKQKPVSDRGSGSESPKNCAKLFGKGELLDFPSYKKMLKKMTENQEEIKPIDVVALNIFRFL